MFINRQDWRRYAVKEFLEKEFDITEEKLKSPKEIQGGNSSYIYIDAGCISTDHFPACNSIRRVKTKAEEDVIAISKADLRRCKDSWMNNPLRKFSDQEADVRFLTTLFAAADNFNQKQSPYIDKPEKYQHDQRAGSGRGQQFLNWLYDEDGYPGRVNHKAFHYIKSIFSKPPIILLDPEKHLKNKFTFTGGLYHLNIKADSALHKAITRYKETEKYKAFEQKLKCTCEDSSVSWNYQQLKQFADYLLKEGRREIEGDLVEQQKKSIIDNINIHKESTEPNDVPTGCIDEVGQEVREVVDVENVKAALDETLKAFSSKDFLKKFTKDKGVLQFEVYHNWLIANIHAAKKYLEGENADLEKFQYLRDEINELLLLRDFLVFKKLKVRDAQLNITTKELKDLFHQLKSENSDDHSKALANNQIGQWLGITSTDNKDVCDQLNTFVTSHEKLDKNDRQEFIDILQGLASTDIQSIKVSTKQRIKEVLYNMNFYIPGSSLWLKYLNPASSRITTSYNRGLSLYCKNREIYETTQSKEIREALHIEISSEKYVPSKHEAKCLVDEFRRKHHMMGAKEKFIFKIKKHRVVWLPFCIILSLIMVTIAVTSRVLLSLHVVPASPVNRVLSGFRGFVESSIFIFGLDTFLDLVILRVIDFVSLAINYIDRYLLGSIIRSTLRLIIGITVDCYLGIRNGVKSCLQSFIEHGVIGSLSLAADNIKSSLRKFTWKEVKNGPKAVLTYISEKIFFDEEVSKSPGFNIPVISLFYNIHDVYTKWQKSKQHDTALLTFKEKEYTVEKHLKCDSDLNFNCENTRAELQRNIVKILTSSYNIIDKTAPLMQNIIDLNKALLGTNVQLIKTSYEQVKQSLNSGDNEERKGQLQSLVIQQKKVDLAKQDWKDFAQNKDKISSNINAYSQASFEEAKILSSKLKSVLQSSLNITLQDINSEISAKLSLINSLIETLEDSNIGVAQDIAQPIFKTNQELSHLRVSLYCYGHALKDLHDSEREADDATLLYCLNYNFCHTLSDAFALINKSLNELHYSGVRSTLLKQFTDEFAPYILHDPSSEIKEIVGNLLLYHGRISSVGLATKHFLHFVKEYQEPKRLLILLGLMEFLKVTPAAFIPEAISNSLEVMMGSLHLHEISEVINSNEVAQFIHYLYETAEAPRDLMEAAKGIVYTLSNIEKAEKDHHHGSHSTEDRVKGTINLICSLLFSIIGINLLKSIAAERGYNKKQTLQRCYATYFVFITVSTGIAMLCVQHFLPAKLHLMYTLSSIAIVAFMGALGTMIYGEFCASNDPKKEYHQNISLPVINNVNAHNAVDKKENDDITSQDGNDSGLGSGLGSSVPDSVLTTLGDVPPVGSLIGS